MFAVIRNCGRWSDKVAAALPNPVLGKAVLEKNIIFECLGVAISSRQL